MLNMEGKTIEIVLKRGGCAKPSMDTYNPAKYGRLVQRSHSDADVNREQL